ncbi:MAG: hypothetical protein JXR75_03770 [Rhodobacteraceae bacterium]|nr:hypothetical protein [Paracoccaceae bacterium]
MVRQIGTANIGLGSELGYPPIQGVDPAIFSFPATEADQSLIFRPLKAGAPALETWALGLDLYIPQPNAAFTSLLQTGTSDGALFLRDNGDGTAGVGISGVFDGSFAFDQWNRLIVTVSQEGSDTVLRKYLNGVQIGSAHNLGVTDRWDIDPSVGLKLLNDNDGETSPGAISGIFFSPVLASPADVAGLAASIALPNAAGFLPGSIVQGSIEINFADEDIFVRYGEAEVILDGFGFRTPVTLNDSSIGFATQFDIEGPGGDDALVLAYADYSPAEGVLLRLPGIAGDLSSYTAVWDINVDALAGFQALLQTDVGQGNDGELFIRGDGGIGISGNYDGAVAAGVWSRIAITVQDLGNGTATLSKYLDGVFLDSQIVDAARFTLSAASGFLLMTDDDGETGSGYLAHFGLSAKVLDAAAIAALGGADGDGPFVAETGTALPLPATGTGQRTLTLNFDSSFRPYDGMTGEVMVSIDGGAFQSLLTLTSANSGGDSSLSRVNETIELDFVVDEDAQDVAFAFNLRDGGNDWWWAIDNIALEDQSGAVIYAENFDGLGGSLTAAVDENIAGLGWTDLPPDGWTKENDPGMPQGTTEWQGWSFATPDFWTSADGQNRADFTLGQGVVAIADPDEWDDFNAGSQNGADFGSTITTPTIALQIPGGPSTFQIGFDGYTATVQFGFASGTVVDEAPVAPTQDNIDDLLLRDDGTVQVIDLAAAFGADATDFVVTAADGSVVNAVIDGTSLRLNALELGHSDIVVTALVEGATITENFRAIVAGENAYVFAIIPDTQDYTSDQTLGDNSFFRMTEWMLDQQDSLNIAHAIHVGDIVQFGATSQWEIAKDAMERLDGKISYTTNVGNHDQQRPGYSSAFSFETDIDTYFTAEQVGATAAQGGGTYDGLDVGPDTFGNGNTYANSIRNHYTTIQTPDGQDWLIFSLEFGMPDDVLRWAGEVIEQHLDHRVIIDTHSWNGGEGRVVPTTQELTTDNGGWGYAIRENPRNVNDGEDGWREFASKYPNISFTFNGHNFVGGAQTVIGYGPTGDAVHQVFVNYQNGAWAGPVGIGSNGGNGALRLVVVDPDNNRFTTHTKLVELDTFFEEFPDHQEVFEGVDFGAPQQIAIAKAGPTEIVAGDGVSAAVLLDPSATIGNTAGARYEWFTADGEKLGETDGTALSVALATGTNRLTLKVTDVNGAVSLDEKVVIVSAPGAMLAETFDDGVLDGWGGAAAPVADPFTLGTDVGFALPSLTGAQPIALQVTFDSSFRPYDSQTGEVMVSFDEGATFTSLLTLNAATSGGDSSLSRANEAVTLDVLAPADAASVQFAWRMSDSGNDWWWAIDNIEVTAVSSGTVLLAEGFEDLALQPFVSPTEGGGDGTDWTDTLPTGWTRDNSGTPIGNPVEFQGWTLLDKQSWVSTAGDQNRSGFTLGQGTVAVADGDEYDDGTNIDPNLFDSTLRTPSIDLTVLGGGMGGQAGVISVPALGADSGILVTPTGATGLINSYTMIFDLLLAPTTSGYTALFQTDVTNAGDGEMFLRNDGATASLGISGNYDGALEYGQWGRVALTFQTEPNGQQTLSKYLDGVLLDTQVVDSDVSNGSRWSINADTGFLLLSDNDGDTSDVFLNAVHFTTEVLDAAAIAALGGVDSDGPVAATSDLAAFQLSFDGALDAVDYGAVSVEAISPAPVGGTSFFLKGSIFGNPNGVGEAALYQQSNGANEVILWQDGDDWSNYVFDSVIEPADNDTIGALFYYKDAQNHYRLTMDQQNDVRTLVKVQNGVETVLASETGSYRHFAMQDLRIAVMEGRITITLDDEALFDGPVTDAAPLAGGTVGFIARSMDRVMIDNVSVNPVTLAARALTAEPEGRWAADLDNSGHVAFEFTAEASLSAAGIVSHEWLVGGDVVATGQNATLMLGRGDTTVTLRVTDAEGRVAEDRMTVSAASYNMILAQDDFADGDLAGWAIVDEGTLNGPSDWVVQNGALIQRSDIASTQQGTGSASYSVAGDGPYVLRDGTYALRDDPGARDWTDYAFEATLTPNDDDGIGLLFRYADADNYYKLEADAQTGVVMLTRHLDGRETILARAWGEYTPGVSQQWRVEVEGGEIRTWIDGKEVFGTPVEDRTLASGTVGLYAWGSENLAFDDVVVTLLEPPINIVTGTAANEFLQGTDDIDLIISGGGTVDRIQAGAGVDHFDFSAIRADSGRNIIRVSDIEVGETIFGIDPDFDIVKAAARGTSLHITLAGDGDQLILTGVTAVDDLFWQPADTLV